MDDFIQNDRELAQQYCCLQVLLCQFSIILNEAIHQQQHACQPYPVCAIFDSS